MLRSIKSFFSIAISIFFPANNETRSLCSTDQLLHFVILVLTPVFLIFNFGMQAIRLLIERLTVKKSLNACTSKISKVNLSNQPIHVVNAQF